MNTILIYGIIFVILIALELVYFLSSTYKCNFLGADNKQ